MAFMGETTEVGVAELLSVLARRGHTGRLAIAAGHDDTQIYLDSGKISLISSNRRELRLGRVLVRLGAIDEASLDSAVRDQYQADKGRPLGQILIESGRITPDDLRRAAEEQCVESLARVIVAPHGSFVFNRDLRPPVEQGLLTLNAEGIVFEASRRADEMTRLRALLPPPGVVLGLTPNANAQAGPLSLAEVLVADALRREPQAMASLAELLPLEEVALWRAIVRLRERGLIYAVAGAPVEPQSNGNASAQAERSIPEVLQLGAAGVTARTRPLPTLDDIRAGELAGDAVAQVLRDLLNDVVTARNELRTLQALSHYSDDYFRRRGMMETAEIEALRRSGPSLPASAQERLAAVRDVRRLADGRASAVVISVRPGSLETRKIIIFSPHDSGWRIDGELL